MADTPFDWGDMLGSRDAVVAGTSRAAVLRAVLPSDPFEGLFTARIPEPPVPTADLPPPQRALIVVRAYLGALKAAGMKSGQWAGYAKREPPDITKSKAYPALARLADLFAEHSIPPAAWAAFRLDCLKHAAEKKGQTLEAPSLQTLMSAKWLEEGPRRGWFRRDYASRGWKGRVVTTPSRTRLMKEWTALQQELDELEPLTVETARAAYRERFPGDLLETLIRRASDEGRSMQAHYDALAAQGEWLWK